MKGHWHLEHRLLPPPVRDCIARLHRTSPYTVQPSSIPRAKPWGRYQNQVAIPPLRGLIVPFLALWLLPSVLASSSDPRNTPPKTCTAVGDSDLYGKGVRFGLYLQWAAHFILRQPIKGLTEELRTQMRGTTNVIGSAVALSTILSIIRGTSLSLDYMITFYLTIGLFYAGSFTMVDGELVKADYAMVIQNVLFAGYTIFGIWFWQKGLGETLRTECQEQVAIFFLFELGKPWTVTATVLAAVCGSIFIFILGMNLWSAFGSREQLNPLEEQYLALSEAVLEKLRRRQRRSFINALLKLLGCSAFSSQEIDATDTIDIERLNENVSRVQPSATIGSEEALKRRIMQFLRSPDSGLHREAVNSSEQNGNMAATSIATRSPTVTTLHTGNANVAGPSTQPSAECNPVNATTDTTIRRPLPPVSHLSVDVEKVARKRRRRSCARSYSALTLRYIFIYLAGPIVSIVSVERMIAANGIVTSDISTSTGQMLAFLTGIFSMVMALRDMWTACRQGSH